MNWTEHHQRELDISRQLRDLPDPLTKPYLCTPGDPCGHCDLCDPTRPFTEPSDNGHDNDEVDNEDELPFIRWPEFWAEDPHDQEWLIDDVFARGRGHAIYAQQKQGKSLYVLYQAARLATLNTDVDVMYLDYEMSRDDVRERLDDMGYGPTSDLTRLHYNLLPQLAPLDTGEGITELIRLYDRIHRPNCHVMVIVDTTSRAVQGDENSNDTIRNFYRWTGSALKHAGATWARVDHAGKDPSRGQRGGSAKGDDVDIVWRLQATDDGIILYREAARMAWVEDKIAYTLHQNPTRYERADEAWPPGTRELADQLAHLDIPLEAGRPTCRKALKEAGVEVRNDTLAAAIRWRKRPQKLSQVEWDSPKIHVGDSPADTPKKQSLTCGDSSGDSAGQSVDGKGPVSPPLGGDRSTRDPQPEPYELIHYCRCGAVATDISGLCPGCQANPGTLPPLNRNELF